MPEKQYSKQQLQEAENYCNRVLHDGNGPPPTRTNARITELALSQAKSIGGSLLIGQVRRAEQKRKHPYKKGGPETEPPHPCRRD